MDDRVEIAGLLETFNRKENDKSVSNRRHESDFIKARNRKAYNTRILTVRLLLISLENI